jgi:dephospho-CoA kinase
MTQEQARARILAQATDGQREQIADYVINSDCTMSELIEQVDAVFAEVTS